MKTIEYHFVDKKEWLRGEWDNEPDKIQYQEEETGYPCIIRRHASLGFLCGYVGVNKAHPLFGKFYDDANGYIDGPHGGLTFSDKCQKSDSNHEICHIVEKEEDGNIWWFGFDCGHSCDFAPGMASDLIRIGAYRSHINEIYRNIEYVKSEIQSLAQQLKQLEKSNEKP